MRGLWWALLTTLCVGAARAELDAADYKIDSVIPAGQAREQTRTEIARDIEQEARQAQREAEQEAQERAQAAAEEARRPYPQRLLQARCTPCHPADNYLNQRHTEIGWHGVILRMRWFNRAPIALDEQALLAGELTRVRPAAGTDALVEYGLGAGALTLLLAVPLLAGWGLKRRGRRRV
jgi:hypothetical protein